jgi:hypothetical protein
MSKLIDYPTLRPTMFAFMLRVRNHFSDPLNSIFKIQTIEEFNSEKTEEALLKQLSDAGCSLEEYQKLINRKGANHFWVTPKNPSNNIGFVVECCPGCGKHNVLTVRSDDAMDAEILATNDEDIIRVLDGVMVDYLQKAN